jgi:molybdate transport system ATP-binding protein
MLLRCRVALANFELDIDVSFDAGVTSIFGPSGSGKTTILDAIAGLSNLKEGEIEINGRTLFSSTRGINLSPQERFVGYVPQDEALFPHLSVRQNVLFGSDRVTGITKPARRDRDRVLDVLEISDLLDRPVTKLSGGEAQRVALARAVLSRPKLLLLDEPLAALDIALKEKILPYLIRVRDEFSIPMIYVTHNLSEVLALADWMLMIRQGRLLAQGVPKEVLRSLDTIVQIAEDQLENVFSVITVDSDRTAGRTRVRLTSGQELFIPYAPQSAGVRLQVRISGSDILVSTQSPEGISAGNILPGTIKSIEIRDGQAMITVMAGAEFYVRLTASAVNRLRLVEQHRVFLIMKTHSFRLL